MEEYETLSLRARRKKPSVSLSCCFNGHHQRADSFDATTSSSVTVMPSSSSRMSPSSLKGRYRNLISRMGRHRRHSSADFSYDPLSYALNFQDNDDPSDRGEDFPIRSFASRLPLSPPGSRRAATPPCATATTRKATVTVTSTTGGGSSSVPLNNLKGTNSQQLGANSRAAAVAEVRKSLEDPKPWKLEEIRRSLDMPPTPRKVKITSSATESAGAGRRNIDLLTPRAAAEVRRSYDYEYEYEEVSPALVASPTSRQVLVELC